MMILLMLMDVLEYDLMMFAASGQAWLVEQLYSEYHANMFIKSLIIHSLQLVALNYGIVNKCAENHKLLSVLGQVVLHTLSSEDSAFLDSISWDKYAVVPSRILFDWKLTFLTRSLVFRFSWTF